jgi:hypothetical protein
MVCTRPYSAVHAHALLEHTIRASDWIYHDTDTSEHCDDYKPTVLHRQHTTASIQASVLQSKHAYTAAVLSSC